MIQIFKQVAAQLQEMADAGVKLHPDSDVNNDYAILITEDPAVAEKFGFILEEFDEDDVVDCGE